MKSFFLNKLALDLQSKFGTEQPVSSFTRLDWTGSLHKNNNICSFVVISCLVELETNCTVILSPTVSVLCSRRHSLTWHADFRIVIREQDEKAPAAFQSTNPPAWFIPTPWSATSTRAEWWTGSPWLQGMLEEPPLLLHHTHCLTWIQALEQPPTQYCKIRYWDLKADDQSLFWWSYIKYGTNGRNHFVWEQARSFK